MNFKLIRGQSRYRDLGGLMKLITPLTILNQNFHEMDLIRDAMKNRRLAKENYMMITEKIIKIINLLKKKSHSSWKPYI